MKMRHYLILLLSLILSFNAVSDQTESTNDYAYGVELTLTDSESMFSQVELDEKVYTQTISPQLDDVRVFNRNGQTVPFALVNVYDKQKTKQEVNMIIYPINQNNAQLDKRSGKHNYEISIQGKNINISLDQATSNKGKYVATYLLQMPNDSSIDNPISTLQLSFKKQQGSWQVATDVAHSSDLKYWSSVVTNVPLMKLVNNDNQTLTLNDISFPSYSYYKSKNWLITLYSQHPIPDITKVVALSESSSINNSLYPIEFSLVSENRHSATYTLPTALPIKELTAELYDNLSVLPVSIYYKASAHDENWLKLEDRIIRRTYDYDESTRILVEPYLIQQIKLETINSSFAQAPKITAYRNRVNLIFNSANNAPFILAWGSAQAKAAALPESALLSKNDTISDIPKAYLDEPVKLAGEKALTADANQSSSFPRWIIWLSLIIGAGVLVLLALKLVKDIKKQ